MSETGQDFSQFQQPRPEAQLPTHYAIPLEAFQGTPPERPAPYKAPAEWTRANFTKALTDSFARSRAHVLRQFAVFEWQRVNQGFDYEATIQHYVQAGGFRCLSPGEQQYITNAFKQTKQHAYGKYPQDDPTDREILETIDRNVVPFFEPERSKYISAETWPNLQGMSWEEFLKRMEENPRFSWKNGSEDTRITGLF